MAKIIYMMSFSRSGETLLQRHLAQNPKLHIGYDLSVKDSSPEIRLKRHLMRHNPTSLSPDEVEQFGVTAGKVVAKAIWPHENQSGFILARHPLAIVGSIAAKHTARKAQSLAEKISRICGYVDPALQMLPSGSDLDSLTVKIASAWAARMRRALASGSPVIRYEDFVTDHESALSILCQQLGVDLTPEMLAPEKAYPTGMMGHGGLRLDAPIDPARAFATASGLSEWQRETTLAICADTMRRLGYDPIAATASHKTACCAV